ncbi:MAG: hypothetical protein JJU36_14200 [Phycisphaeraceae bacterium]|nr:hypothetical protein [Phycisphaeraceae bacterium]
MGEPAAKVAPNSSDLADVGLSEHELSRFVSLHDAADEPSGPHRVGTARHQRAVRLHEAAMRKEDVAAARPLRQAMDRDPHPLTRPDTIDPEALRQLAHRYRTGPGMDILFDALTTLESS